MKRNRRRVTTAQVARLMALPRCCGKVTYSSRVTAEAAIAGLASRHEIGYRAYRCPRGQWHLTSAVARRP